MQFNSIISLNKLGGCGIFKSRGKTYNSSSHGRMVYFMGDEFEAKKISTIKFWTLFSYSTADEIDVHNSLSTLYDCLVTTKLVSSDSAEGHRFDPVLRIFVRISSWYLRGRPSPLKSSLPVVLIQQIMVITHVSVCINTGEKQTQK